MQFGGGIRTILMALRNHRRIMKMNTTPKTLTVCLAVLILSVGPAFSQNLLLDFNTPGQLANFNVFGTSNWGEGTTSGIGGGGGVNVTANNDATLTYKTSGWDFSTAGKTMLVSVLIKANAQTSGNKIQLGIINVVNNGLNANA